MCKTYQVKYESPFTGFFILDMITDNKEEAKQRREELMKSYDVVKIDEVEEIDSCYSIVEMEPSEEGDMIRLVENFENYLCAKFVLRALMEADVNFKYYKIVKTSEIKAGKHFEKSE